MNPLVDRLIERLNGILREAPKVASWSSALDTLEKLGRLDAPAIAERVAINVREAVAAVVPTREREAVLDRPIVAERWPLLVGSAWRLEDYRPDGLFAWLVILDELEGALADGPYWPSNVAVDEVAEALERIRSPEAQRAAEALRRGNFKPGEGFGITSGTSGRKLDEAPGEIKVDATMLTHDPHAIAVLVSAQKQVRSDAGRRFTPIPSNRHARAAMSAISRGSGGDWEAVQGSAPGRSRGMELVWGKEHPTQYQLTLAFDDIQTQLLTGIMNELAEDGLRDYMVLHRMAAEQERTGAVRWTWREHRERTAYDRRIRSNTISDTEAQSLVTGRLWRLKSAELHHVMQINGRRVATRVGPFGLIDIPAHVSTGGDLELARIALNPILYESVSASADARDRHFTLLEDEAFALDGTRFRLAVLLSLQMRTWRDHGGVGRLSASTLWGYMNVRAGKVATTLPRHRWPAMTRALEGALNALEGAHVIGGWNRLDAEADVSPEMLFEVTPTAAWKDQVVHRVPPELPPSRVIPRTVGEFKAWRLALAWSQDRVATELGVGLNTIKRAEVQAKTEASAPLGSAILAALAARGATTLERDAAPDRLAPPKK